MKRRILSILLAVALLASSASASFSDIEDSYTQQAASALASMGIITGNGRGEYEPDRLLSRAEFTRLAVGSLGVKNVDNYSSYTIFPDVPAGHWASGWVNAAVRHPDFEKNPIIRGLGNGTFAPNNPTTLGEACTMALRMLGYEQKDIGPFWPNDYVAKANALGLLANITVTNPYTAITRGDAAILFRNTLTTDDKEGKSILTRFTGNEIKKDVILLATSDTDSSLNASQVTYYTNPKATEEYPTDEEGNPTEKKVEIKKLVGVIDPSVVGSHGILILDKDDQESVVGFLPDQRTTRHITLERIEPEGLLANDGTGFIYIPRHTPLVVHGNIYSYGEGWTELDEGGVIDIHYDANGVVQVISASAEHLNFPVVIIGINGTEKSIPSGYKLELDGKRLRAADKLELYDVILLDSDNRTALVSRNRITGRFDEASPSFRYPEWIQVLNAKFDIPENFATSFKQMDPGDQITLLFDTYGRIVGVTADPRAAAATNMEGVVTACTDDDVTVRLFNGVSISGKIAIRLEEDEFGEMIEVHGLEKVAVGQQVRISQNNDPEGTLNVIRVRTNPSKMKDVGNWDIKNRLLGFRTVSKNVQVFEQVDTSVPLLQISEHDIDMEIVPENQIITFKENTAGVVTAITLRDVTGESWIYGRVKDTKIEVVETHVDPITGEVYNNTVYDYRVELTTLEDGKSVTKEFLLNHSLGKKLDRNQIIGLPASAMHNQTRVTLSAQELENLGKVTLNEFDGYSGVKTKHGYYPIDDDVPVYQRRFERCITLRQAKASYSAFELYADKPVDQGGKVRVIVV